MQQQNIPIATLVDMFKRGEMHLPEIQRHYVWRATRFRDLLDSLYRGYPLWLDSDVGNGRARANARWRESSRTRPRSPGASYFWMVNSDSRH